MGLRIYNDLYTEEYKSNIPNITNALEKLLPEVVSKVNENGYLGVDYTQLVPVLFKTFLYLL